MGLAFWPANLLPADDVMHYFCKLRWLLVVWLLAMPSLAWCQTEESDFEDEDLRPGLIGSYRDAQGHEAVRVDRELGAVWNDRRPDPRLAPGPFSAEWRGYLMSQASGTYRFHVYAAGHVTLRLGDRLLLEDHSETPAWMSAEPIELPFDWHPLEITYRAAGPHSQLRLYWEGPQFQLEPIGPRQLYHRPSESPDDRFARGQQLVRALRCGACHSGLEDAEPMAAPALTHVADTLHDEWLPRWLRPAEKPSLRERRMPDFDFSEREAQLLAVYLRQRSEPLELPASPPADTAAIERGHQLALTRGCLACHRIGSLGRAELFGGGDLSRIAEKRPAKFFSTWLAAPQRLNPAHRMPLFSLSDAERADLAAYLASLGMPPEPLPIDKLPSDKVPSDKVPSDKVLAEGKRLFEQSRCAACHERQDPSHDRPGGMRVVSLPNELNWSQSCLAVADKSTGRPGYQLSSEDADAVIRYVEQFISLKEQSGRQITGEQLLLEHNCLACHQRGSSEGLAELLPDVANEQSSLAAHLAAMTPPSLISVGDKLHDRALEEAIRREGEPHRPYLMVQMPRFTLRDTELTAIVEHLVASDRIPPEPPASARSTDAAPWDEPALQLAGQRLVTSDGFGCTSCHAVGSVQPPDAPLHARGPDLSRLGGRIRRAWFDRWVRNPARIVPRMEMPSVQLPVPGVLDGDLDTQLAAVWEVLNLPGFQPPAANPVRVVRRTGVRSDEQDAVVLTDVLRLPKRTLIKPLLVALPNRHNLLIDLEHNQLAGWWIGDAARQRTEGKTWFWEPGGTWLWEPKTGSTEIRVRDAAGQILEPIQRGQFLTEFDWFEHQGGVLQLEHRLDFQNSTGDRQQLLVAQTLAPVWADVAGAVTGIERTVQVRPIGSSSELQQIYLQLIPTDELAQWKPAEQGRGFVLEGGAARIEWHAETDVQLDDHGRLALPAVGATLQIRYLTQVPVDQFLVQEPAPVVLEKVELNVVPGYEAIRLPLPTEIMPTALAWRPGGKLVIASLKGRVWQAIDRDGDGLHDQLELFSDELAAPYGLQAHADYVDVITKFAVLRLWDRDQDGRAERTETLVSGWGHSADYHDWAVGLPRDPRGCYYVALPCQQDDRSPAAAHLRGRVLQLIPREPTRENPHRFTIRELSAGHRFPMGMARRRTGELFVTDNQGNYNPFNELNHVLPGAHYGFINALERGTEHAFPPLQPPAINIPHPWTRSVNGICFLESPQLERTSSNRPHFGAHEGHLIGSEYDTRRLVRMSLEQVDGTYQGAVYPLSLDEPAEGPTFLGPICCEVSPEGDLYVGCIRDSGWGGANNVGGVVRLRPIGLPAGIAEVHAVEAGLAIDFTEAVDPSRAGDIRNYDVASYTRVVTPAYGGPDQDRRRETITGVEVDATRRRVILRLKELRPGYVYELSVKNLTHDGRLFFPAEAYYTLNELPAVPLSGGK